MKHVIYLDQILHTYCFWHYPATGMQNGGKALSSIIFYGLSMAFSENDHITLEPHGIF